MSAAAATATHAITLSTSAAEQWVMLTNGYTHKLPHAIKELVDNCFAAFAALHTGDIHIRITIAEHTDGRRYRIRIEDSGPGIPLIEIAQCLSLGKAKRTGLNEHGCGLKNVLAFCCPVLAEGLWELVTRPIGSDKAYRVASPWQEAMLITEVPTTDHAFPSGVTISMIVEPNVLQFYNGSKRGRPAIGTIVKRLKHHLGVTYALHPLMDHPRRATIFTINDERVRPELPRDAVPIKKLERTISLAEGSPAISMTLQHLRLKEPNGEGSEFYCRNTTSSGVYLFLHGRLVARISPADLYDLSANHNDFNAFVCIVDIRGDPAGIPSTLTTKNGVIETDPRTIGLYDFIRDSVTKDDARDRTSADIDRCEGSMTEEFIGRQRTAMEAVFGDAYSIIYNRCWPMGDGAVSTPPIDIVEILPAPANRVVLYEAKVDLCTHAAVLQIYGNYRLAKEVAAFADKTIVCQIICGKREPTELARRLLADLATLDPSFRCAVKTWGDLGISRVA